MDSLENQLGNTLGVELLPVRLEQQDLCEEELILYYYYTAIILQNYIYQRKM